MVQKLRIDLPIILPDMEAGDRCVSLLTNLLKGTRGVEEAHVIGTGDAAQLCLHYDPNLLSLGQVQRLAEDAGATVTERYRHDEIPITGMHAADSAPLLTDVLHKVPGVLHAQVNYAAGLAFVAYDTTVVQRPAVEQAIRRQGFHVAAPSVVAPAPAEADAHEEHDHASAPAFLPHALQERWTVILVGLAGTFLLLGWVGQTFLGLPEPLAVACFVLAYIAGGYDLATHAIPALFRGKFDTDILMLAAAGGAAVLGEWSEGAFLLFLFALAHLGEHYALDRARNAVKALGSLMPKTAHLKRGDQVVETNVDDLLVGDVVIARPGDHIPVDGTVVRGDSAVDQSPVTGESVPVAKHSGGAVFAGTINQDTALEIKVTKLAKDNTLSRVMQLVAEAQQQQSPTQRFTEQFSARFVPAVLLAAVAVTVVPPLAGWMPLRDSFYRAMLLLVAASPCALVVGTPAAVLAGIARAARSGVLIKGGVHLENLGRLKAIAFDKTGTLTEGRFAVTDILPLKGAGPDDLLRVAGAVEQQSNHPLAQAVMRAARERNLDLPAAGGLKNIPGRGVRSVVGGQPVLIGSLRLFEEQGPSVLSPAVREAVDRLEADGRTTMVVGHNGALLGVLGLADTIRPGVAQTMARLRDQGIEHLVMLTGDNEDVAKRIASQAGVTDVQAELLPEDKLTRLKDLQAQFGAMAMVGDGVNDAPALATATVGVAMGGAGTAVALETADVALMADDVSKLPFAVGLSRASRAVILQNLVVSLAVISLLILTSVLGLVQLSWAVILHEGSTIAVVLNALRLLGYPET